MPKESGPFRFKQFNVQHDRCAMKVGTDAVLLGAWANITGAKTILDVGTGSGIIALMLAQRSAAQTTIDAVEVEEPDAAQAEENVMNSPWPDKIHVHHTSIQNYSSAIQYDVIVSNPPYFSNSLLPPSSRRETTRHTQRLSHDDLLSAVKQHLSSVGKFSIVLPTEEGNQFQQEAQHFGLHVTRRLAFYSRAHKSQERWLLEFAVGADFQHLPLQTETLTLYSSTDAWSPEYQALTGDFYLPR